MARYNQAPRRKNPGRWDEGMMHEPTDPRARQAFDEAVEVGIRGDVQAKVAALKRAIDLEPTYALAHVWLGASYFATGSLRESVSALDEAIRLEPRCAEAYALRSLCHERLGDGSRAVADRKKGLTLPGPQHSELPSRFLISLYSEPFLREARATGVDIDALLERIAQMPDARVLEYPDGTVQLEGEGAASAFEAAAGFRVRERAFQRAHAEDPLRMRSMFGQDFLVMRLRGDGMRLWGPNPPADIQGFLRVAEHFGAREHVPLFTRITRWLHLTRR
ncbi:tetratricopeptide repeat protein [Planctomycetota bacterium]